MLNLVLLVPRSKLETLMGLKHILFEEAASTYQVVVLYWFKFGAHRWLFTKIVFLIVSISLSLTWTLWLTRANALLALALGIQGDEIVALLLLLAKKFIDILFFFLDFVMQEVACPYLFLLLVKRLFENQLLVFCAALVQLRFERIIRILGRNFGRLFAGALFTRTLLLFRFWFWVICYLLCLLLLGHFLECAHHFLEGWSCYILRWIWKQLHREFMIIVDITFLWTRSPLFGRS